MLLGKDRLADMLWPWPIPMELSLYRERGLLTSAGEEIKNREEILPYWKISGYLKGCPLSIAKDTRKRTPRSQKQREAELATQEVRTSNASPQESVSLLEDSSLGSGSP